MFRAVAGHARLLSLLSRAVARETLPPSLLFAGPPGVGKARVALAVAQALNCLEPVRGAPPQFERDACGRCAACRRIARGVHPDVLRIEPGESGSIKIEQVREVIDRAAYRPFEGRRRVVIVDDADALVAQAQHALLKTLEEPPSGSVFVLVSARPDALLATVRSRCPRLRFGPLTAVEIAGVLVREHGYADGDARAAAADADGSLGRALALRAADQAEARAGAQRLLERAARQGDPASRIAAARDLAGGKKLTPAEERERLAACLRALESLLRDVGVLALGANAAGLANPDLAPDLERLAKAFGGERSLRAFAAVDQALTALDRNASSKIVADWVVMQI